MVEARSKTTFAALCASVAVLALPATALAASPSLQAVARDSARPLVVRSHPGERVPYFLEARVPVAEFSSARTPAARGRDFWRSYGRAFGVRDAASELALRSVERDGLGMTHLRYDQVHDGLPVFARQLVLHLDGDAVTVVNGDFAPAIDLATTPRVGGAAADRVARARLRSRGVRGGAGRPALLVYVDAAEEAHLAWRATVATARPLGLWRVFVDAVTGDVLAAYDDLKEARNRTTYTNANDPDCNLQAAPSCLLPGAVARTEGGGASGDSVVDSAHDNAGIVYDYYAATFGRDSYDGAGHVVRSTVHFGSGYNNAFWCDDDCAAAFGSSADGEQMVYGDGDGTWFSPLGGSLDVVAHELTHAVTDSEAGLVYFGQPGALNESYSDVFGVMVDDDDWLIGDDVYTPGTPGDALRSMSDPALFGQPAHMADYVHTMQDNAGVHVNSGIPNRAAYLIAADPSFGIGRAATERIYYRALTVYLTPRSDFVANLAALVRAATDLYGTGSPQARAVTRGFAAVGVASLPIVLAPNGGAVRRGAVTTIRWAGGDAGRAFAVEYLRESTPRAYSEGFEASTTMPARFVARGDAAWVVDAYEPFSGSRAARSGTISHDGRSELSLTATTAAEASVSFKYRVSSERDFDFFSFSIDGAVVLADSGDSGWRTFFRSVPAGTHTFTWVYDKDWSESAGLDAAWIDELVVPSTLNAVVTTINAATAANASSQGWTPPAVEASGFKVRVRRAGIVPWLASDVSDAAFRIDVTPPGTAIAAAPRSLSRSRSATFGLTATEPGATFQCSLDGAAFAPCPASVGYTALAQGRHTFRARARDAVGHLDETPAAWSWVVDSIAPRTRITAGPSGTVRARTARFRFASSESRSRFQCSLDRRRFARCRPPRTYNTLAPRRHTFRVRAVDAAGNVDRTPALRRWVVRP